MMTTATIMTVTGMTTITAVITIAETTNTITTMIRSVTIIVTTITQTDGTHGITKGTTGLKTYARNDGAHPTPTVGEHAPHGPTCQDPRSNKNDNWYW